MRSEWQMLTLEQAGVRLIDCDHRTPAATSDGFPYIAIPQLKDGHIDLSDARRISAEHFKEWTKKLLPREHDVVVVRRCNSGDSAVIPKGVQCAIGQNLVVLRTDGKHVAPRYLRWLVRGEEWWEQVRKYLNVGAVFDSLKCRDVPNFVLPIPPLCDQEQIADCLETIDRRVVLSRQENATLDSLASLFFKSWFARFEPISTRAQGRHPRGIPDPIAALFPSSFEDSVLGPVPKGWRVANFGDICTSIFSGGTPDTRKAEYWNGQLLWFSSGETRERVVVDTEKRITAEAVKNSSTRLAMPGDILIASAGQGATRGQTSYCAVETYINQSVVALRTNREIASPAWTYYNLARRYDEMRALSDSHSIRGSLTTKILSAMPVVLPPKALMDEFARMAEPLLDAQALNRRRTLTLRATRDKLMPGLLSGKLRLPECQEELREMIA